MGKIKSKLVKRNAEKFIEKEIEFTSNFEENKKMLGNIIPNKKTRNQMAGYLARLKKLKSKQGG
jgi:ribosomal protein S17E